MRTILALLAAAAASLPLTAQATVSDDLVFCSKLVDRGERVACYNAAARIAENARTRKVSTAAPAPSTRLQSQPAAAKAPLVAASLAMPNPFDGFYVAGGGSYGWSTERPFSTAGGPAMSGHTFPNGASGALAAGYNVTSGRLLFGLEVDGRWGRESAGAGAVTTASAPLTSVSPSGIATASYTVVSDIGAHLSARAGGMVGDTLVFGKVGVGAARVIDSFAVDNTGFSSCFVFGGTFQNPFCVERRFQGRGNHDVVKWLPALLLGVGAERNFGQFFVRVNAEAEMIGSSAFSFNAPLSDTIRATPGGTVLGTVPGGTFTGTSGSDFNGFWTFRAGGMVGMRF